MKKKTPYNVNMKMKAYKLHPENNSIEIDGKQYHDGDSVRVVSKNLLFFSYYFDTQFYGISKETGLEVFKNFLTVRFLLREYNWTFRTNHPYPELPYIDYKHFEGLEKIRNAFWNCWYRLTNSNKL